MSGGMFAEVRGEARCCLGCLGAAAVAVCFAALCFVLVRCSVCFLLVLSAVRPVRGGCSRFLFFWCMQVGFLLCSACRSYSGSAMRLKFSVLIGFHRHNISVCMVLVCGWDSVGVSASAFGVFVDVTRIGGIFVFFLSISNRQDPCIVKLAMISFLHVFSK